MADLPALASMQEIEEMQARPPPGKVMVLASSGVGKSTKTTAVIRHFYKYTE
jgi:hypothetical protein